MAITPPKLFVALASGILLTTSATALAQTPSPSQVTEQAQVAAVESVEDESRWVETNAETTKTRGRGVGKGSYYGDRERGYYWYEEDPDKLKRPPPPPPAPAAAPSKAEEMKPFSVDWLKVKLEETRKIAIDNPTRENVELYVYYQKIAMDKAEKYALMSQQVAIVNPELDESYENPTATMARKARQQKRDDEQVRTVQKLAREVGIYYFFKSDCQYCAKQNGVLSELETKYGFRIMPISIDHLPLEDGAFPQWTPDRGQAMKLGISATPTLYMFHPPNEIVFLSVGVQTEGQLMKRIIQIAQANNWISRDELETALRGLPRDFLVDAVNDLEEVDWNNPEQALDALRYASQKGVEKAKADEIMSGLGMSSPQEPEATPLEMPPPQQP